MTTENIKDFFVQLICPIRGGHKWIYIYADHKDIMGCPECGKVKKI